MGVVWRCQEYKVCFVFGLNNLVLIRVRHLGTGLIKTNSAVLSEKLIMSNVTLNILSVSPDAVTALWPFLFPVSACVGWEGVLDAGALWAPQCGE